MLHTTTKTNHSSRVFPGISRQISEIKELLDARRFEREVFNLKYEQELSPKVGDGLIF